MLPEPRVWRRSDRAGTSLPPLYGRGQRCLKLLRWYACSRPLLPGHLWPTFAVDEDELFLGRASGYFEEPNTLGAIHAGRLLLWLRLGSSLERLGLSFGLYLSGGAHLADGRLAGHSGSPLYAIDLSFLFGCPINLFHLLLSCVPSSKQLGEP